MLYTYRKIVKIVQSSHTPQAQFPLLQTSHISKGTFVTINKPTWIHYYEIMSALYSYFLSFPLMSFFHSKVQHSILSSCFISISLAATISQTFLVFDDLDSFKAYWSDICSVSLNWDLSDESLMIGVKSQGFFSSNFSSKL